MMGTISTAPNEVRVFGGVVEARGFSAAAGTRTAPTGLLKVTAPVDLGAAYIGPVAIACGRRHQRIAITRTIGAMMRRVGVAIVTSALGRRS